MKSHIATLLMSLVFAVFGCSSSQADDNRVSASKPTADALWKAASEAFKARRFDEAAGVFKQLANQYPSDQRTSSAYYFVALSSFNLKRYAVAVDEFRSFVAAFGTSDLADDALFFAARSSLELQRCTEASKFVDSIETSYPTSNVRDQLPALRNQIGVDCCAKLTEGNECWFYAPAKRRCTKEERTLWDALLSSGCGAGGKARSGGRCYTNEGVRLRLCTHAEAQGDEVFEQVLPAEPVQGTGSATLGSNAPRTTAGSRNWLPRGWTELHALKGLRAQLGDKWKCNSEGTTGDGSMSFANCKVCRDGSLTFPCAEVALNNGEVIGLLFPLARAADAAFATQELTSDWGQPTRSLRNPYGAGGPVSLLCWDREDQHAALIQRRAKDQPEFVLIAYSADSACPIVP